jgi:hypothetical protein
MSPISIPLAFPKGTCGNRMKVAIPAKRGVTSPDSGLVHDVPLVSLLFLRKRRARNKTIFSGAARLLT